MKNFIFFLFPKFKKAIKKDNDRYFNLSIINKNLREKNRGMVIENRMMSEYILTLEKRLENYEAFGSISVGKNTPKGEDNVFVGYKNNDNYLSTGDDSLNIGKEAK